MTTTRLTEMRSLIARPPASVTPLEERLLGMLADLLADRDKRCLSDAQVRAMRQSAIKAP